MCTVMQKDVLIEMVSYALATINVRTEPNESNNEDQRYLMNLRNDLYSTHHHDIEYEVLSTEVRKIKDKYIKLPVHQYYA